MAWVLRESVTNVVRHARARSVVIELGPDGITVTDDGRGCVGAEGNGLRGMRERVGGRRRHARRLPGDAGHPGPGGAPVIRLLLADDQALVRGALAALLDLESDLEVVAQVGRGDEVVEAARASGAEVCLLDIEMPGLTGIDAAAALRRELPAVRSLIVTTFGRPGYVRRAIEAGASGFVVKDTPARQLADAVRRVHSGLRVIDPDLAAESLIDGPSPLTGSRARAADVRPRRVAGRDDRRAGAPLGGHRPQPPVRRDRQDRRDDAQRGRPDRAGPRLAVSRPSAATTR